VRLAEGLPRDGVPRAALVMTLAAVRLSLVGLFFMEVRYAPLALKVLFHAWVVVVWGVIVGVCLTG
jgi:hypothetical protein